MGGVRGKVGILFLTGVITLGGLGNGLVSANDIDDNKEVQRLDAEQRIIEEKIKNKSSEVEENQKRKDEIIAQIEELNFVISGMEEKISDLGYDIELAGVDIKRLQDEIIGIEEMIEKRDTILMERMKAMQVSGGKVSYIDVLLGSESFADFIDRFSSVRTLVEADRNLIREQEKDRDRIQKKKDEVQDLFDELNVQKDELEGKLYEVEQTKNEKNLLIDELEELQAEALEEIVNLERDYSDVMFLKGEIEQSIIAKQMAFYESEMGSIMGRYCSTTGELDKVAYGNRFKNAGVLTGKESMVIDTAERYNVDPVLMVAIVLHETGNGTSNAIKMYNNPGGIMSKESNWSNLVKFDTLQQGLNVTGKTLNRIINKEGKKTIHQIGNVYAPIGADNDPTGLNRHWSTNVSKITEDLGGLVVDCKIEGLGMMSGDWVMPTTGRMSSQFGWRLHPIDNVLKQHRGMDISNEIGTPIYAVGEGVVTEARVMGGFGNVVMVTHLVEGKVLTTVYAHLSAIGVNAGDRVTQGQHIGNMGETGKSTGSHLHFEVHEGYFSATGDSAVNPLRYLTGAKNK